MVRSKNVTWLFSSTITTVFVL